MRVLRGTTLAVIGASLVLSGQAQNRAVEAEVRSWRVLPGLLAESARQLGERMQSAGKENVTLTGLLTDSKGERPIQISMQAPGRFRLQDSASARPVTFDGMTLQGAGASDTDALVESLVVCTPENLYDTIASRNAAIRAIGGRATLQGWEGPMPASALVDIYEIAIAGKVRGNGFDRQQRLWLAVDSVTQLPVLVRRAAGGGLATASETRFLAWQKVGTELFASQIVRMEGGKEVFRFRLTQAQVISKQGEGFFRP